MHAVPQTILEQLGGQRFCRMTGAKHLVGGQNTLSFHLPARSARNKATAMLIRLMPDDTYSVQFKRVHGTKVTDISEHNDIYCDQLVPLFERETGLYTKL